MSTHPVETYLKTMQEVYRTGGGTAEESYYGALENLLNEIGEHLKPRVRCVSGLANLGAGEPDFGLYTASQFQHPKDECPIKGVPPERGVIEAKPWGDDSFVTAGSRQVTDYWKKYNLVLVTNYRDFVLIGRDPAGKPTRLEWFRLVESEAAFLAALAHPRKTADEQGERMIEFLRRAMLHAAPLTNPEDVAWFLASYAREARARVEAAADLPALKGLKKGLEEALGMKFEGDKGEHFFRATLVQTLFYGIFSSWVLWARERGTGFQPVSHGQNAHATFDWHAAGWTLHVPMVESLFDQIATPTRLKPLRVDEVLDWAGLVLNRVDRRAFFEKFEEENAVQYFYEPFLKAYDPQLRKELGVWYTPPEIVKYQVERVDRVLREELDLPDGLADDRVVVLDPCCGTGAYLVEVLRKIHETLRAKGSDALVAQRLKRAAIERIFGFEILPAPFVVSHLQLGLLLRRLDAPLRVDSDERAGVYLTNALTGWEPPQKPKDELPLFPELMAERDAANKVKCEAPILVILGNPPYNAFAGTSPEEEGGLVKPYKEGLTTPVEKGGWGIKKFNLDDLYVRFLRIAERRIVKTGRGVVSYISNYSWTSEPSFVVLRKRLLESFDKFWIENMHGNRKISEYAPDGRTSETIFAIPGFSPGIQQGIVVSVWVKRGEKKARKHKPTEVLYRDDINAAKAVERRQQLLASLATKHFDWKYRKANPTRANRFSFRPEARSREYRKWPRITEFSAIAPSNGLMEKRGGSLIDIDRVALERRMRAYFDPELDWEEYRMISSALTERQARFDPKATRTKATAQESFRKDRIVRYAIRPFEVRWAYYTGIRPVWNEPRPSLWEQCWSGNRFLLTRFKASKTPEGLPFFFTPLLIDDHFLSPDAVAVPLQVKNGLRLEKKAQACLLDILGDEFRDDFPFANLSDPAREYLSSIGIRNPDKDAKTAELIWMHVLAIGYSPGYLKENADGIRQDWPRIPLPDSRKALLHSAELGRRVAALLDTDRPVQGVTCGTTLPELRTIAVISRVGGGPLNPDEGHLDLTAGWGHAGKGGVCMPGSGKYELRSTKDERQKALFGEETLDVYLNEVAYWANVPKAVWEYYIGGYQVIKKWLSYREKTLLGRGLKLEEAEYVTEMARRIAAIVLLQPELDANYQAVKSATWPWPS
jgi:hypothetical protein